MHMQEGVGRHGYRLLALVFFFLGLIGLSTSLYAFRPSADLFDWIGFAFEAIAVMTLFGLALVVIQSTAGSRPRPVEAPRLAARAPLPASPAPAPTPVSATTDIAGAPPLAAPESLALPDAFQDETPPQAVEPAKRSLARPIKDNEPWLKERQNRKLGRRDFAERYTQNAPEMRQILVQGGWPNRAGKGAPNGTAPTATGGESLWENEDATPAPRAEDAPAAPATPRGTPTVLAKVSGPDDSPDWVPDGMGRGRCGGCDTIILAPQERPIQLKCPKCNRVTLLQ